MKSELSAYKKLFKKDIFLRFFAVIAMANLLAFAMIGSFHFETGLLAVAFDTVVISVLSALALWLFIWRDFERETLKYFSNSFSIVEQKLNAIEQVAVISISDEQGVITFANKKFAVLSGYSIDELLGQKQSIVNSGFHDKEVFRILWSTIQSGQVWSGDLRNQNKKGEFYWLSVYILPLFNHQKKIINYLAIGFDITDQKRMEHELDGERKKSIHMARLSTLGEMAANIAHEINNPLSLISGSLMLISEIAQKTEITTVDRERIVDFSGRADFQAQRLTKIVKSLRGFARGNADAAEMKLVKMDDLVESVKTLCHERIFHAEVDFRYHPSDFSIYCHQIQMEQVLVNLVNNAVDAIAGTQKPWVQLIVEKQGDSMFLKVRDSGLRISDEMIEKMSTPYFTTKEVGKGTGLGLSISRTIIGNHKGSLGLDREDPHTCFVIKLPHLIRKPA